MNDVKPIIAVSGCLLGEKIVTMESISSTLILMSRSPSCGLKPIEVFNEQQELIDDKANGLWANFLEVRYPFVPKIDSSDLDDEKLRVEFFESVEKYKRDQG